MATLTVGAGQQYTTISSAIANTHDGDVVLIQAGTYLNDFATIYTKITLQSVGGLAVLQATRNAPNGKAILTTETDVTIDGLGFTGATDGDTNGAGIRYEGGNLVVRNSVFWNNQDGILGNNDPNGTVLIQGSEFSHNGAGDGYSHGIYINDVKSLTVQDSYFHDAQVGHEIKSRAEATTVTGNRIFDNTLGTASYSIDVPDGGVVVVSNNIIEKGANTQNPFSIHYGGEGLPYANNSLSITGNTFVNDRPGATLLANQTNVVATLSGNSVYNFPADKIAYGPATVSGITTLTARPTLDTTSKAPTVLPPPTTPPEKDLSTGTSLQNWGTVGAVIASGHILTVGPTGVYRTLMSAVAASQDGDTIQVAAGTYLNDFADINHKIIIQGVGGMARFVQSYDPDRLRGIVVANTDVTLQNIEIAGADNWSGKEAGLMVTQGNVTVVNSIIDNNDVGIQALDNPLTNIAIYGSEIRNNGNPNKGTDNATIGAINSFTLQGSSVYGAPSGHQLSVKAFNSDIENNRIGEGNGAGSSFEIDLGAGGAAVIKNNVLIKGAYAANGLIIHVGGEGLTYANSNVQVTGNTLITSLADTGHPYTYFVVGDPGQPLAPITVANNIFVGGVPGSRWLTNASDGGGNVGASTVTLGTAPVVSATAIPPLFVTAAGADVLTLVLSEQPAEQDAQFLVTVDGVGAGGGVVTAREGVSTQTFRFAGNWTPGPHQVAVTIINSETGDGGGAYSLTVKSVSLDGNTVAPNIGLNWATYTATLGSNTAVPGFDPAYYLAHNPDVAAAGVDPLQHFLVSGWHEGRNPSAVFDTNWYLTHNPDVKAAGLDPLLHYDTYGWKEGRDPSLVFSTTKYLAAHPMAPGATPLDQFLVQGRASGITPPPPGGAATADPLVDAAYYGAQLGASLFPAGVAAQQQAASLYHNGGWLNGLNPDAFFNTSFYLAHNPDVAAAHVDPLIHYETFGWKEGRDPSAAFSTTKYLAANMDVRVAGVDPLLHYVQFGLSEGRLAFAAG